MTWSKALRASKRLGPIIHDDKHALEGRDKKKIQIDASCSVALDEEGPPGRPGEKRWDYLIVVRRSEEAHAVEIHQATPGNVKEMIAKKAWAERLLARECPGHTVNKWHWVARTRVDFPRHRIRELELLGRAGIEHPCEHLKL